MEKYYIYISPNAHKDLDKIYHYVAMELGLPDSADQLYESITGEIYRLTEFPRRYASVQSEPERSQGGSYISSMQLFCPLHCSRKHSIY